MKHLKLQLARFFNIVPTLLIPILLLFACNSDNNQLGSNADQFNLDLFEQNLIDYVNAGGDSPVGWAYAITQNGERARDSALGFAVNEPRWHHGKYDNFKRNLHG